MLTAHRNTGIDTGVVCVAVRHPLGTEMCIRDSFSTPGMTDESNALVKIVLNRDSLNGMSQELSLIHI